MNNDNFKDFKSVKTTEDRERANAIKTILDILESLDTSNDEVCIGKKLNSSIYNNDISISRDNKVLRDIFEYAYNFRTEIENKLNDKLNELLISKKY